MPHSNRYKRSSFISVSWHDKKSFDLQAFLKGKMQVETFVETQAFSCLTGLTVPLSQKELAVLSGISCDWATEAFLLQSLDADQDLLLRWSHQGLLVCDLEDENLVRLREREEILHDHQWHPLAAFGHFQNRGAEGEASEPIEIKDIETIAEYSSTAAQLLIERHGPPPAAFHQIEQPLSTVQLPEIHNKQSSLYRALQDRHTLRSFDRSRLLPLDDLTVLLQYTFGCHGITQVAPQLESIRRTSPSGGSMHPIEAYPLILRVEGLETGFYHYNSQHHRLDLMQRLEVEEAETLAGQMADGQGFVSEAHVLVFLTARFYRNFWKYRRSLRTYNVILMDAGHLSQTFYLVATELGLGVFYTGAINAFKVEQALGLDGFVEGAVGICGCGIRPEDGGLKLERQPFLPET